jgi:hypothetical protein
VEGIANWRPERLGARELLPSGGLYAERGRAYMLGFAYDGDRKLLDDAERAPA